MNYRVQKYIDHINAYILGGVRGKLALLTDEQINSIYSKSMDIHQMMLAKLMMTSTIISCLNQQMISQNKRI